MTMEQTFALTEAEKRELGDLLKASQIDLPLEGRHTIVFVYPGLGAGKMFRSLSGCTAQLCRARSRVLDFQRYDVQLAGLSSLAHQGEPVGFPVGQIPPTHSNTLLTPAQENTAYTTRKTFIIFEDGTGIRIENISDTEAHVDACLKRIVDYTQAQILLQYAKRWVQTAKMGSGIAPNVSVTPLQKGADSVAIEKLSYQWDTVVKVGKPSIIDEEAEFIQSQAAAKLFPELFSHHRGNLTSYYSMQAVSPSSIETAVFEDLHKIRLKANDLLPKLVTSLDRMHRNSLVVGGDSNSDYLYLGRFEAVPQREDFTETFHHLNQKFDSWSTLSQLDFWVDGFHARSYDQAVALLKTHSQITQAPSAAICHGDPHLKNILFDDKTLESYFIDPRVKWENSRTGKLGMGDPLYDHATLFHSFYSMSAILEAITLGENHLGQVVIGHSNKDLEYRAEELTLVPSSAQSAYLDVLQSSVHRTILGNNARVRLHIGTANAFLGWLKYERSLKYEFAWWLVYASMMVQLELGCREIEQAKRLIKPVAKPKVPGLGFYFGH